MEAKISIVENHGSIIIIWLDLDDGGSEPVYFDHRSFGWVAEGEGIETASDLIGRPVFFDGETIEFLDTLEAA